MQTPPDYKALAMELAEENERLTALCRQVLDLLGQYTAIERYEMKLKKGGTDDSENT